MEAGGFGQIRGQSSGDQDAPVVRELERYLGARFLEREQARRFHFRELDNMKT